MLTATLSPVEHVGFTLVHASSGGLLLILDARRSNAHFLSPPGVRLLSSEGFGRVEVALPEGVDVESEGGTEALNKFSIAIATTGVRVCFHRFRMPPSLSNFSASDGSLRMCYQRRERCSRDRGRKRILPCGHVSPGHRSDTEL